MIFESKNFGGFSIGLCGLGVLIFFLILIFSDDPGAVLSDKSVLAILCLLEAGGVLCGAICLSSLTGKIGLGIAALACVLFGVLTPPINLPDTTPSSDPPVRLRIRQPRRTRQIPPPGIVPKQSPK